MMPAFFKTLMKRFRAKWTRFAWEACQFWQIGAETADQDEPCGNRCSPLLKSQGSIRALSIIGPADGKAPRRGK
jgi:hypothetical protein